MTSFEDDTILTFIYQNIETFTTEHTDGYASYQYNQTLTFQPVMCVSLLLAPSARHTARTHHLTLSKKE